MKFRVYRISIESLIENLEKKKNSEVYMNNGGQTGRWIDSGEYQWKKHEKPTTRNKEVEAESRITYWHRWQTFCFSYAVHLHKANCRIAGEEMVEEADEEIVWRAKAIKIHSN